MRLRVVSTLFAIVVIGSGVPLSSCDESRDPARQAVERGPASDDGGSDGEQPGPATSTSNAAPEYRRLASRVPAGLAERLKTALSNPDSALDAQLKQEQPIVRELIAASKLSGCDFSVDRTQGLNAPLPHLADIRMLARLLGADARRCLDAHDGPGAAARAGAAVRMGNQLAATSRSAIEEMVAAATVAVGAQVAIDGATSVRNGPEGGELRAALRAATVGTPAKEKDVLRATRDITLESLRRGTLTEDQLKVWSTSQKRQGALAAVQHAFDLAIAAWDSRDAVTSLKNIDQSAVSSGIAGLLPEFASLHERTERIRGAIASGLKAIGG